MGIKLKLATKQIKKLNNQTVVVGGLPRASVIHKFPEAVETLWDFELKGDWDLQGYTEWMAWHATQVAGGANNGTKSSPNYSLNSIDSSVITRIYLTPQQVAFLSTWERDKYPVHVDIGFLESLKLHLNLFNSQ